MTMARIRLRAGHVELSFEGSEEYIKQEAVGVFEQLVRLGSQVPGTSTQTPPAPPPPAAAGASAAAPTAGSPPAPSSTGGAADPVVSLSQEIGVDVVHVVSAFAPSEEEPYLHIDRHYWAALKANTPRAGVNAVPPGTLGSTLLALWFMHLRRGAPSVDQVRALLAAASLDNTTVQRSVNNCSWLQLRGEAIFIKPAEIKRAIELAAAFCEKRAPRAPE